MTNHQADDLLAQLKAINENMGRIAEALKPREIMNVSVNGPVITEHDVAAKMQHGFTRLLRMAGR